MSARDFESTPGQLYCRRFEPDMIRRRNGRSVVERWPFASSGFIIISSHESLFQIQSFTDRHEANPIFRLHRLADFCRRLSDPALDAMEVSVASRAFFRAAAARPQFCFLGPGACVVAINTNSNSSRRGVVGAP